MVWSVNILLQSETKRIGKPETDRVLAPRGGDRPPWELITDAAHLKHGKYFGSILPPSTERICHGRLAEERQDELIQIADFGTASTTNSMLDAGLWSTTQASHVDYPTKFKAVPAYWSRPVPESHLLSLVSCWASVRPLKLLIGEDLLVIFDTWNVYPFLVSFSISA